MSSLPMLSWAASSCLGHRSAGWSMHYPPRPEDLLSKAEYTAQVAAFSLTLARPLAPTGARLWFYLLLHAIQNSGNGGCDGSENGMGPSMLVCRCWRRCQSWSSWTTTTGNREGRVWLAAGWCCIRLLRLHYTGQVTAVMALNVNGSLFVICPARCFTCIDR